MPIVVRKVSLAVRKTAAHPEIRSYNSVQGTHFSVYHVLSDFKFINILHCNRKDVRCQTRKKKSSSYKDGNLMNLEIVTDLPPQRLIQPLAHLVTCSPKNTQLTHFETHQSTRLFASSPLTLSFLTIDPTTCSPLNPPTSSHVTTKIKL
jgi:hypothetical protein